MKEIAGQPIVVGGTVMGVVTRQRPRWLESRESVLVVDSKESADRLFSRFTPSRKVMGCILSEEVQVALPKYLASVTRVPSGLCSALVDGDVVRLYPDGRIAVVYEIGSHDNSVFITNKCNSRCVMCPQPPGRYSAPSTDENLRLIGLMDRPRTKCLGITGGEPTLEEDHLLRVLSTCRTLLPNARLNLLTNGRRLKDLSFAKALVKAAYPYLTIDVPLYADTDSEHDAIVGVSGSFFETLEGLHNLALLGQWVGLRTVLHRLTVARLTQYAEFIYRNLPFVSQVAFMGMETTGLAKDNLDSLWVDPVEYQTELEDAVRYLARRAVPVFIYNHQICVLNPSLWPFAVKSISGWKQAYLPECSKCEVRDRCGGFFGTGEKRSSFIQALSGPQASPGTPGMQGGGLANTRRRTMPRMTLRLVPMGILSGDYQNCATMLRSVFPEKAGPPAGILAYILHTASIRHH